MPSAVVQAVVSALIAVTAVMMLVYGPQADMARRLRRLERQVRELRAAAGLPPRGADHPEVLELLRAGRRIEAIRVYRQRTGASLRESVEAVDGNGLKAPAPGSTLRPCPRRVGARRAVPVRPSPRADGERSKVRPPGGTRNK